MRLKLVLRVYICFHLEGKLYFWLSSDIDQGAIRHWRDVEPSLLRGWNTTGVLRYELKPRRFHEDGLTLYTNHYIQTQCTHQNFIRIVKPLKKKVLDFLVCIHFKISELITYNFWSNVSLLPVLTVMCKRPRNKLQFFLHFDFIKSTNLSKIP